MDTNLKAFSDFRNQLKSKKQFANGDEVFNGYIEYDFRGKHISERLEVKLRLTTIEYGQISISDGEFLYADLVHMELNPNFQEYSYKRGIITVTGQSQKLGKYSIAIMEE